LEDNKMIPFSSTVTSFSVNVEGQTGPYSHKAIFS